jgi:anti-sigma factor RsiW
MNDHQTDPKALVGSLLGPEGPEVGCEECFELLDQYVEVELAGGDTRAVLPGMDAHLEGCPACREDAESLRAVVAEGPAQT